MFELRQTISKISDEIVARQSTVLRLRTGEISSKSHTRKFIVKCPECPAFVNKSGKCTSCGTRICMHCRDKLILNDGQEGTVDDIIILEPVINSTAAAAAAAAADASEEASTETGSILCAKNTSEHKDNSSERDPTKQYHVCDKETLATAQMIEKDTKPCPKCGNRIHKIEGCDQMFDPQCGTAFSWRTGQIVTGIIHNPHYFQWQQENRGHVERTPGDILCGGPPDAQVVYTALGWVPTKYDFDTAFKRFRGILWPGSRRANDKKNIELIDNLRKRFTLMNTARILSHIQHVELPVLQTTWDQTTNRKLRVQYIMKELSEEDYKYQLAQRERKMEKHREIQQIFDTFLHAGTDILRKFVMKFIDVNHIVKPTSNMKNDLIPLVTLFEDTDNKCSRWWTTNKGDIRYKRAYVKPDIMYVPSTKIIDDIYNELIGLENYCNDEFAKISNAWKLVAPEISIETDSVTEKRWYHFRPLK